MPYLCSTTHGALAMGGGLVHAPVAPMTGFGSRRAIRRCRVGSSGSRDRGFRTDSQSGGARSGEDPHRPRGVIVRAAPPFAVIVGAPGLSHPGPRALASTLPRLHSEGAASLPKDRYQGSMIVNASAQSQTGSAQSASAQSAFAQMALVRRSATRACGIGVSTISFACQRARAPFGPAPRAVWAHRSSRLYDQTHVDRRYPRGRDPRGGAGR